MAKLGILICHVLLKGSEELANLLRRNGIECYVERPCRRSKDRRRRCDSRRHGKKKSKHKKRKLKNGGNRKRRRPSSLSDSDDSEPRWSDSEGSDDAMAAEDNGPDDSTDVLALVLSGKRLVVRGSEAVECVTRQSLSTWLSSMGGNQR